MKKLFLALLLVPTIQGYSIKVQFSDGIKKVDTQELDQFESTELSSLIPIVHKVWAKNLKAVDSQTFKFLTSLTKLDDSKLFNFLVTRTPEQIKLLSFNIRNLKIDNKLRLATNMAFLKNPSLVSTVYPFDGFNFAQFYLYDYFKGKVWEAAGIANGASYSAIKNSRELFYDKYYGDHTHFMIVSDKHYRFTTLLHYHDQVLKKPLVIDTPELKETFIEFDSKIQNHLVENKFVTLT